MTTPRRSSRTTAAGEAWVLMGRLFRDNRHRFFEIAGAFELSPPLVIALNSLQEDEPMPMSALAGILRCDNSNVTGIVDRLEARGLVERRSAEHDRRVKHLHVTPKGAKVREQLSARMSDPPEAIKRLSAEDARALRDILRRAVPD
jgi:DNA-binding MarR family transcriptional regulator